MSFLQVKGWDKFQHYKDRCPPWIKLQTDTFQNYKFSRLHDASKLLAVCIWTLASRSKDGSLPADFDYIKRQCNLSDFVKPTHLQELISQGFVIDASNTLAPCKQTASPETETETETEGETDPQTPRGGSRRFEECFWSIYPNKIDRAGCEKKWKARNLDAVADEVKAGVHGWIGCDRWLRGFITNPSTFLQQERWKDTPPAGEPKKGELRVREVSPAEKAEAEARAKFFELMKANPGKSEAEIQAMMRAA